MIKPIFNATAFAEIAPLVGMHGDRFGFEGSLIDSSSDFPHSLVLSQPSIMSLGTPYAQLSCDCGRFKTPQTIILSLVGLLLLEPFSIARLHANEPPSLAEEKIVLRTIAGEIILGLYPDVAPQHVAQIIRLVEGGVFDGSHFCRLDPEFILQTSTASDRLRALEPNQSALIHPLRAEFSQRSHTAGVLSMAHEAHDPDSAETSFTILLGDAPHLDGKYTVFGEVLLGWDVIEEFTKVPCEDDNRPMVRLTIDSAVVSRESLEVLKTQRALATAIDIPQGMLTSADAKRVMEPQPLASSWGSVELIRLGLLGVSVLNVVVCLLLWYAHSIRVPLMVLLVSTLLGLICLVLIAAPSGQRKPLIGAVLLLGWIAHTRFVCPQVHRSAGKIGKPQAVSDSQYPKDVEGIVSTSQSCRVDHEARTASLQRESARVSVIDASAVALVSLTMALAAANMFILQPMIGKLLAPWLGSVPAVWTACMLFFQLILLAGYIYAHWISRTFELTRQFILHGLVVTISATVLPLAIPQFMINSIPEGGYHALWIMITLLISVGLPALVLSATAPLIQVWVGATTQKIASNPYPLYIASNTGSLLGLLSYPFIIEPNFTLTMQRFLWSISWFVYASLLGIVAFLCYRQRRYQDSEASSVRGTKKLDVSNKLQTSHEELSPMSREIAGKRSYKNELQSRSVGDSSEILQSLRWLMLSFVPSSLLLGVTNHITTDIAAMPMLWTIPLAIYLLSWTFSFSDFAKGLNPIIRFMAPLAAIAAAFLWAADFREQTRFVLTVHLLALLAICWAMHRMLYESRPATLRITSFYISLALGGALGGIFNAIIAPLIFSGFVEYPLSLAMALLLIPGFKFASPRNLRDHSWAEFGQLMVLLVLVVLCTAALSKYAHQSILWKIWSLDSIATKLGWTNEQTGKWMEFAIPLIPAILLMGRPRFQAAAITTALIVGIWINHSSHVLLRERSFFGVLTVLEYRNEFPAHALVHGGIMHGEQRIASAADRLEARSYYHKDGPLGDVMDVSAQQKSSFSTAAIGLGTGSIAAYGQPHRPITFFELDPAVEAIARNPAFFTYLTDCAQRGGQVSVKIGDARLTMARTPEVFDLIVVDAFSSDAIPLHLITKEAIDGWFLHLNSDGVVTFHVSNRYLDLIPVLANAALAVGAEAFVREDVQGDPSNGRGGSTWVVLCKDRKTAQSFLTRPDWRVAPTRPELAVWTDDFASILPVIKF